MVSRERLKEGGLRAYELGRLRMAARAAWFLVPVAVLCMRESGAGEACACIGVLLLAAAVFLRWRNRERAETVTNGLLAGSVPLITGRVAARVDPSWVGLLGSSACTAACLGVGVPAGIWMGLRAARGNVVRRVGSPQWRSLSSQRLSAASGGSVLPASPAPPSVCCSSAFRPHRHHEARNVNARGLFRLVGLCFLAHMRLRLSIVGLVIALAGGGARPTALLPASPPTSASSTRTDCTARTRR